ncbi:Desumoylating isopeptidase 1 [Penicillium ucsense]|uniref:Desumoylating isopeptidase 1 n=1 Tax=Penicillium ucsense TaxID=2839758 RepID=A0A8J8WIV2_9EURO|nr:Desumoylating isopeptidase 1 [Penicillium ucsense]KAF7734264.1 Desumoylating isopeptidase 1 [Penicillium ucsense]
MEVELYVYDLSKGLARVYSQPLTGTQIDAIYHTSLVVDGVEYYFGQGIQTARPGSTHHGQPMEKVPMGKTELPVDVIQEYLESLAAIYTPESYDLFLHNCNNFTQDFAMFLVGKSIPGHIRDLPRTFLETPFGQMMKPQIEAALKGVTQGSGMGSGSRAALGDSMPEARAGPVAAKTPAPTGVVRNVSNLTQMEDELKAASNSCAVIFFTSSTCAPCRIVYPTYDDLAEEVGEKGRLIKVDISTAYDVSTKYHVHATPTFMTFLKGKKKDEWSGASPAQLKGHVRMLLEQAYPTHPHRNLRLPSLQRTITNLVMYKKVPPLDKLLQKLPSDFKDAVGVAPIIDFVRKRHAGTHGNPPPADVRVPDLHTFASTVQSTYSELPSESLFAVVDLVRVLFLDPRVSGYFAEEANHATLVTLFSPLSQDKLSASPYNLRIVSLQLICNLFSTPLYPDQLTSSTSILRETLLALATNSLLDSHSNLRVVAASFAYNLAAFNHNARFDEKPDRLSEEDQVELTASLLEAISQENESAEALHGLLFALGLLIYEAPTDGTLIDLCRAMGVRETVSSKAQIPALQKEPLIKEVGDELFGKGL